MGSAKVITKEIDLSTRVPSFPGVYGGIVIPAVKGPVGINQLVTNETQLLDMFTPDGKVEVGHSTAFFSALAYLQKSNKLWVRRAINAALYGGASIKSLGSAYNSFALAAGMSDPSAYSFDSLVDVVAVKEVFTVDFAGLTGASFDVAGAGKYFTFEDEAGAKHHVWFHVTDGANAPQTDPAPAGSTAHEVAILSADTAAQIATKTAAILAALSALIQSASAATTIVTVTMAVGGVCVDAAVATSGAVVAVTTQGVDAINTADEALLIYAANPGAWANKVAIKVTTFTANPDRVKEPGAFIIDVYKTSNLNVALESFLCSRTEGHKDGYGNNIFVEDVLEASNYIRAISNPAIAASVLPKDITSALTLGGGNDGVAVTDTEMVLALSGFASKDDVPLTLVMDGGWATPVYQQAIDTLVKARGDSVGILSTPIAAEAASTYMTDLLTYKRTTLNLDSSYSALYTPHPKVFDKFNNRSIFVAPDGYAAAAISYSASNFEIWFPPAGFKRGAVTVLDLRRRFTEGERDTLYDAGINPFRFVPGRGIYIWGQKTLAARPSALDRLNVRLMLIVIEPAIATALEDFLFELNDEATRSLASAIVSSYMDNIKGRRGVTDFRVVCDSSNNSDADIDAGRMNMWLFVKPTRSAEEIPFSVVITSTGISFELAAQLVT
jgi:hypothetical protein